MRTRYLAFVFFIVPSTLVFAHVPISTELEEVDDPVRINDPSIARTYYGLLQDFPHTYEIVSEVPFRLKTEVLVPDLPESKTNVSGLIVREIPGTGRVEEVARLSAGSARWEPFEEPYGGDWYKKGAAFDVQVPRGVYRIEVSTPDNREKYALAIGFRKETKVGYVEALRRVLEIKSFFEKPWFSVLESPIVHIPLMLLCLGILYGVYMKRYRMV